MKKAKLFVLIPALFALTACGLGKEVDEQAAKDYEAKMAEEPITSQDSVNFNLTTNGTQGKDKVKSSAEYKMKINNKTGNSYFYASSEQDGKKSFFEAYVCKDETYEEVTWVKYLDNNTETTVAYTKKGNEIVYTTVAATLVTSASFGPVGFYTMFSVPTAVVEGADFEEENAKVQYYSNGEKNLSVKVTVSEPKEAPEDEEEYATSGSITAVYDIYLLKSFEVSAKTNLGNSATMKASASYGEAKVSLPKDWEKVIVK